MEKNITYDIPPLLYLKQVAYHCPKAMSTYLDLWEKKGNDNILKIYKEDLKNEFLVSLCKFTNDLRMLVREGLVSFDETQNIIKIDITGWDEEREAFC